MSIKNKALGAFLTIIVLTLISSILVSYNITNVKSNVKELSEKNYTGITFLLEADRDSYQSNVSLLQIMELSDINEISKRVNKGVNDNLDQVGQRFQKFKDRVGSLLTDKSSKFSEFDTYYSKTRNNTSKLIDLIKTDKDSAREFYFGTYLDDYEHMRDLIDYFTEETYKVVDINKENTENIISTSLLIFLVITIITIVVAIAFTFLIGRVINNSIGNFQYGLLNFFKYLNGEINNVELLDDSSKDEISIMSKVVNENITKTKKLIEDDNRVLNEVKAVVSSVKNGKLKQTIQANTQNKNLEELKITINEMLSVISQKVCDDMSKIDNALNEYKKFNFAYRIDANSGYTTDGLNNLANIISEILVENKSNGLTLQDNSSRLLNDVEELTSSTNSAAASLEETSAALEEINSNVRQNTENVLKMVSYANELTSSANEGETMAKNTTIAMDEINEQVSSINEAISVIDQIAFQTNILSLNAAVEAATAGEAGKGFAVVAGEVRNLASRSAEAAKEIKELVESATTKANSGKSISDKMISGYTKLNENVSDTLSLIKQVEVAIKEQQSGIEQINNAVTLLDHQTQKNASIANGAQEIAINTQKIAESIVDNANNKEFTGKANVKSKVVSTSKYEAPKKVERTKVSTPVKKEQPKIVSKTVPQTKITPKASVASKVITSKAKDDDEWESF